MHSLLGPGKRQGPSLLPLLLHHRISGPSQCKKQEKEIKCIQIRIEDVKLSVFTNKMIVYVENAKECLKELPELI